MAEKIPVPLTIEWAQGAEDTIRDAYRTELGRDPDRGGFWAWFIEALRGRTGPQIRQALHDSPEGVAHRAAPPPPPPAAVPQIVAGRDPIFRRTDGTPWRWKGVSAFKLLDRFARGEDIGGFLASYKGFNVLRVWPYVEGAAWKGRDWPTPPSVETTKAFLARVAKDGWLVELTLLTDDHPARLAWAQTFVAGLAAAPRPTNLLIEIGNEPRTNKRIDTAALKAACDASGFLYASGDYEDSTKVFGRYGVCHTGRSSDWPRRAHDLLEWYGGGGPNAKDDPPHPMPWVADEPGKLEDVGRDPEVWRAYFAACALFGAGATFHSQTGKYADLPTLEEALLAGIALAGLNDIPADVPLARSTYRRITEGSTDTGNRTYVVGNYMVRCQQHGTTAPEPGWTPLDLWGVVWRRA
jgi:hypothetical protein